MATITIRVDTETHALLQTLSNESGKTLIETVRDAADALRRQRFASQVVGELAELKADEQAWNGYLAEADSTSVADGVDR